MTSWLSAATAAEIVDRKETTLRDWAARYGIATRRVRRRGRWVKEYAELDLLRCERDRRRGQR